MIMITFDDTMIAVWFIGLNDETDWLCSIQEHDDHYEVHYRFRYYNDDKNFDSEDEKHWYSAMMPKKEVSRKKVISVMREAFTLLKDESDKEEAYELLRGKGSFEDFREEFLSLPFVHSREPTKEELQN